MAGLSVRDGRVACDPQLPAAWRSVRFGVRHCGRRFEVRVERDGTWEVTPAAVRPGDATA
jgi:trehalose/maltose hydrolase-like predicted phosphorylase